jgi:hypothetical protein
MYQRNKRKKNKSGLPSSISSTDDSVSFQGTDMYTKSVQAAEDESPHMEDCKVG